MGVSRLAARVMTGTALAVLATLLLWLDGCFRPGALALVVISILALLAVVELASMGALRAGRMGFALLAATLALAARTLHALGLALPVPVVRELGLHYLLAFGVAFLAQGLVRAPGKTWPAALRTALLAVWLLPPLFALALIDLSHGARGLAVLIVLAKVGDNAGYFVGRSLGKRHPFPGLSPGKTVAGCVASLVAGLVTGAAILPFTLGEPTLPQAVLGAFVGGVLNLAAQASDLSESWLKRRAGVKDSGRLLGPSGGVLDVVDSLFFAAPLGLLLWAWVY